MDSDVLNEPWEASLRIELKLKNLQSYVITVILQGQTNTYGLLYVFGNSKL